jgi:hypothetical protein
MKHGNNQFGCDAGGLAVVGGSGNNELARERKSTSRCRAGGGSGRNFETHRKRDCMLPDPLDTDVT